MGMGGFTNVLKVKNKIISTTKIGVYLSPENVYVCGTFKTLWETSPPPRTDIFCDNVFMKSDPGKCKYNARSHDFSVRGAVRYKSLL